MERIDLSGQWSLSQRAEGEKNVGRTVPMQVPGDTFTALIDGGVIPDPYYGLNELETLWVGRADWLISRSVTIEKDFLAHKHVFLHIDSVDTCAEVRVNGSPVAESSNMFKALRCEIGDHLEPGENLIEVMIYSAERRALELSKTLPYPVPYSTYPVQSPHRNLVRKAQCHSGWDWGPCLMVSGLYGEAYIGSCEIGRIDYLTTDQVCKGDVWELRVTVEYYAYKKTEVPFEISIAGVEFSMDVAVQTGKNLLRHTVEIRDPDLWWPAGYGEQKLYLLSVRVGGQQTNKNVGFRTVSVILEDDDAGRSMTFAVNGRKIFCKGANWIPVDALPARQTPQRYERLLADAVAANMNMLRLWGGGQYEREIFYKLCDEKGILVWHDFMFSCSTYPSSEWFLKEVAEEVEHQVKRLKDHPCIALWCGNNENLGALQWYPESRANLARYLVDYDRLYEGVVGRIVRRLDPGRPWWPSSPSAGQGDYSDNWHDDSKGDMHYWSVWHEGKDFKAYYDVTPRFCSEFGFQSFPSLGTVRRFAPEDQWNVTSPIIEHHQRHPRGNTVIIETMTRYFRMPSSFEGFLYLSQVQQALAMKMAVEYWRSRRPVCMGILYWQLDDLWPVASWSSIEYSGKWKLLHYAARKFYAPVHVAVYLSGDKCIDIVGINDTFNRIRGTLEFQLIDFSGRILQEQSMDVDLAPESATQLFVYGLEKLQAEAEEVFVHVLFSQWDRRSGIGRSTIENELFLCPPKRCCLQDPGITAKVRPIEGAFAVELQTERPAFYVSLDVDDLPGIFEDNLFTLLPGEKKTVRFTPRPFSVTEDLPTEESAAVYSQPRNPSAENPLAPLAPLASFSTNLKVFHLQGTYS